MRYPDWPTRLFQAINDAKDTPFAWGQHDCLLFSADVVLAMTGEDHAAAYRGQYTTAKGAYTILKGISPDGSVTGVLDTLFKRVPVKFAMRGDLVAMQTIHGPAIGVSGGKGTSFVVETGLVSYPLASCFTAWRVI